MSYFYVFLTVFFTVYGQLILKWRLNKLGPIPDNFKEKFVFLLNSYTDFWILSGIFSAFLASLFWMASISKLNLSIAYPFMSSTFILVLIASYSFLGEQVSKYQIFGGLLIILGILLSTQK